MYVIKHSSGFYYKENKLAESIIDCFSTFSQDSATRFETEDAAIRFCENELSEFRFVELEEVDE